VRWLFQRAGLDVNQYGQQTLRRRTQACLRLLQVETTEQARRLLEKQPSLVSAAISSLVIGVSSFFRDAGVFEFLRKHIREHLVWQQPRSTVRLWSAGCADGSEMHSMAILLAEAGMLHRCELLGTDCRSDAIAKARCGLYDHNATRGVDSLLLRRYFRIESSAQPGYRVVEPLRRAIQWRTADVLNQIEPGQWNIILCRNMAMYFKPEAAARLWRKLEAALCPGGLLVLGKAERPASTRLTMVAPCIYQRGG